MADNFRHRCAIANSGLTEWGEWVFRHIRDEHGLPHSTAYVDKVGRSSRKDFIPIRSMPRRIAEVSRIVANLPPMWREALSIHYVLSIQENGIAVTVEQRADWLGVNQRTYRYRVSEGRKEVARRML